MRLNLYILYIVILNIFGASNPEQAGDFGLPLPYISRFTSPIISAVLLECNNIANTESEEEICENQLTINVRMSPSSQIEQTEKLLMLDEAYVPKKGKKLKLTSPYILHISRGEPIVIYPLKFRNSFNVDDIDCNMEHSDATGNGQFPNSPTTIYNSQKMILPHVRYMDKNTINKQYQNVSSLKFSLLYGPVESRKNNNSNFRYQNMVSSGTVKIISSPNKEVLMNIEKQHPHEKESELPLETADYKWKNIRNHFDQKYFVSSRNNGHTDLREIKDKVLSNENIGKKIVNSEISDENNSGYVDSKMSKQAFNSHSKSLENNRRINFSTDLQFKTGRTNPNEINYKIPFEKENLKVMHFSKVDAEAVNGYKLNGNPVLLGSRDKRNSIELEKLRSFRSYDISSPFPLLSADLSIYMKRDKVWWRISPVISFDNLSGEYDDKNFTVLFNTYMDVYALQNKYERFNVSFFGYYDYSIQRKDPNATHLNLALEHTSPMPKMLRMPKTIKMVEFCRNNKSIMCLNLIDTKVPEFNMKIKVPFRHNSVLNNQDFKATIMSVVTDATTKDLLQVSIDVINKGQQTDSFNIYLRKCPLKYISNEETSVKRALAPYVRESVTFLLPLMHSSRKNYEFNCEVAIEASESKSTDDRYLRFLFGGNKIAEKAVATRSILVNPGGRCLCIWRCKCHCLDKLETRVNFNLCNEMSRGSLKDIGFFSSEDDVAIAEEFSAEIEIFQIIRKIGIVMITMLFLGFLKGLIGACCIECIDRFGYNCIQPKHKYESSSKTRRFFFNTILIVIYPLVLWRNCCCRTEDRLLHAAEWTCSKKMECDNDYIGDTVNIKSFLPHHFEKYRSKGRHPDSYDYDNYILTQDSEEDENTKYVLQILNQSRSSLKSLGS